MSKELVGIINPQLIKPHNECHVETLTNGKTQVTVYGNTTNCVTYILEGGGTR